MHLESVRQFVHWLHCRLHPYLPMRSQPEIPPPGIIVKTMHSASAIVNSFFFILNITSLHCFGCLHVFLFASLSQASRHFNICGTKGQIACSKIDFSQISSISLLLAYNAHRCSSHVFFEILWKFVENIFLQKKYEFLHLKSLFCSASVKTGFPNPHGAL